MKYKVKKVKEFGYIVTENGHTMFPQDVEQRLKRLDYLEKEYKKHREEIDSLKVELEVASYVDDIIYS